MPTRITLLRGVNVGGKHIVPMKELRTLLESNGYLRVRTYIQSGNIVYEEGTDTNKGIDELIEATFGFRPAVFTLSADDLESAAQNNPFSADAGRTVHFFFLQGDLSHIDLDLLDSLKASSEEYELTDNVFYLYAPDGIGRSKLVARIDKVFKGTAITGRNLNTINKLLEMTK